jgi:predicted GH43/DUF377 family glycosyl hydrolase
VNASAHELFQRHSRNPILTCRDLPYPANSVFNPAAVVVDGETLLLLRVEDRRGISHLTLARSGDGVTGWQVDGSPTFVSSPDTQPEEIWGVEDPRITRLEEEDRWIVAYTNEACRPSYRRSVFHGRPRQSTPPTTQPLRARVSPPAPDRGRLSARGTPRAPGRRR